MRIEESLRSNLMAALAIARRWNGPAVHKDTSDHWRRLLDYDRQLHQEAVDDLRDLQTKHKQIRVVRR